MKLKCLILTLVIFVIYYTANSQEISKLNLPATPAFGILDYEPTSVMRPTNLKSLSSDY